jgi:uncharacterized membrane protein
MSNFFYRNPKLLALVLVVSWNFMLIAYRLHLTGGRWFVFFLWNLFLAILPLMSSELAAYYSRKGRRLSAWVFVGFAVLFLPNSPYIITDLFHLRARAEMPLWYDTMIIFSLALSGLALFYAALFVIRDVLEAIWGRIQAELSVVFLSFLCAFGIYLGRYLRFNSWDVLSNPNDLFEEIADRVINPSVHTRTVGVTLLYGAFLLLGYWVIKLYEMGRHKNLFGAPIVLPKADAAG